MSDQSKYTYPIASLLDVSIVGGTPSNEQFFIYNTAGAKWVNQSTTAAFRSKLDVSVVSVANNDVAKYSSAYGVWRNSPDMWVLDVSSVSLYNPTTTLDMSYIEMQSDGGELTMIDMPIVSSSVGAIESYSMNIDGSVVMKVYGVSSSTALSDYGVASMNIFTYGDPFTNGSCRTRNVSTGVIFEQRIAGVWVEQGQIF